MRILQIRFKNLNSLAGEWTIDLTHPAFAADGLFAITGPTGAGKTTLLDAVCLALYGRTPRLSKVNKGWNEIMSRQTGECFAEVTFETQAGRYRCHWSQRRAHKKPDGELQSPRHEIAHADSGQIVETKARGVAEQIEAATGMDFDRFTRSMLLAQGGFAAFLQASADERAPILEQITGTHIYSRISMRVHERRSWERKKLESLLSELAGMQLLSPEEEEQLNAALTRKIQQDTEWAAQVAEKNRAVGWLEGMSRLEQELKSIALQKEDWQKRQEAFAPEREKLEQGLKAMELAGVHAALESVRREQETDRQNHRQCLEQLPQRETEVQTAETAVHQAVEELEAKKSGQKKTLPILRKTRELDLQIREKEKLIQKVAAEIADLEKSLASIDSEHRQNGAHLRNQTQALDDLLKAIGETGGDERLVEHLAGIRERGEALKKHDGLHSAKVAELKAAERQQAESLRLWQERMEYLENRQRELQIRQDALNQKRNELNSLLEGRELADWRQSRSSLGERKSRLDQAVETSHSLSETKNALAGLEKRTDDLLAEQTALAERIESQFARCASLERETGLLETQFILLKKIQGFEEARHQLRDGEPCPLCGALEHPFAEGNLPLADETAKTLRQARADVKSANDQLNDSKIALAEANKDLAQITRSREEYGGKGAALAAELDRLYSELSLDGNGRDLSERLRQLQDETVTKLAQEAGIVQAAEALEKEMAGLRESLDGIKETAAEASRETQAAVHNKDASVQLLERLTREAQDIESEKLRLLSGLTQEIAGYGVEFGAIDPVLAELTTRREGWLQRQQARSDLERAIAELELRTRHQAEQIQACGNDLEKQRAIEKNLLGEQETLTGTRRELFGDLDPDEEEARLAERIETAEKALDTLRESWHRSSRELNNLNARMEGLVRSMAARAGQLQNDEAVFQSRLQGLGFADEQGFSAANLQEHERKALQQQAEALDKEQTGLITRERDKAVQLEQEKRKEITQQGLGELAEELSARVAEQKALQQEIGGLRQKLKDNEELKQKHRERAEAVEAQKRECSRWDLLHELIGSADGKKYRNFAQGLTFDLMVGHANRQLRKMTDRYLLIRDAAQPLELNVVDNYQAGEIRSTKNLSGGESFIVSLALALGLSQMASKNVRVDSLFLDEGFGTLDEEALETALETLAGLRQDGKLIGIISHVPALKERIGTQIQVIPATGGRSMLCGPGCRKGSGPDPAP
ncbi:AAA family ATPase [Methylosarcina fibrata]|uniref:AAA family ATPase n=1 Tax=Methylosarcina fibrata TaxID=105972 RepID=UPI0003792364|nr:AAA family ATPase [Methylosarcina fibrata]